MSAKWTEFRRRKSRRWWMTGATVAAVAVFGVVFAAASGAVINGFEGNDGNLVVNTAGNTDWASLPINCPTGTGCSLDTPSGMSDNAFTQGTHEDDPNVTIATGSIPPEQERPHALVHVEHGQRWKELPLPRVGTQVNTGSANIDFELDQNSTSGWTSSTTGPRDDQPHRGRPPHHL